MSDNYHRLRPPKLTPKQLEEKRLDETRAQQAKLRLEEKREIESGVRQIRSVLLALPTEVLDHVKRVFTGTAVKIVEHLKGDILSGGSEGINFDDLRSLDVQTADIERDCELLKMQLQEDRFKGKQPCQRIGDFGFAPIGYGGQTFADDQIDQANLEMRLNEDAVESFGSELVPFLTQRVAADIYAPMRGIPGGMSDTPLMLPIIVSAQTGGARVSYSPSYFINYLTLAAPTSPVKGMLLPGRYVFMISTRTMKLFDKGLFDIPPTFDIDLLI